MRKYLQIIYLIVNCYPVSEDTFFQKRQRIYTGISPKKMYEWEISTVRKHLALLLIRKLQIKATTLNHYMYTRMINIKKTNDAQCWQRFGGTRILIHCCKTAQPPGKTL